MHGLHVEYRHHTMPLYRDIAQYLHQAPLHGKVVVVTDKPLGALSAVKKHWLRLEYKLRVERSKTLNTTRILGLSKQLEQTQNTRFSAKLPTDLLEADITFATADNLARIAPECQTLLVTYSFAKEKLYMMTCWMPKNGVVIIYE